MRSTQAYNISRILRLRCGCQFPWCALVLIVGQLVTEGNVAPLSPTRKLDNCHCDGLLPVEEKGRVDIFDEVCLYRQSLSKIFPLDSSIT
jgi:hypothetical protein